MLLGCLTGQAFLPSAILGCIMCVPKLFVCACVCMGLVLKNVILVILSVRVLLKDHNTILTAASRLS